MCGYFCIGFVGLMIKGEIVLAYTNLCLPNEMKRMIKQS